MKKLIYFVLLSGLCHITAYAQPLCGVPELLANEIKPNIKIHKRFSVRDINRINEGYLMLGKVDAQPYSTLKMNKDDAGGCDHMVIEYSIGYTTIDFFMPNDYTPGSCAYNNIYTHEQKHLDKFLEGNERAKAFIKEQYAAIPLQRHHEMNAQADYEQAYVNLFYHWADTIFDQIAQEQKDIDDPVKHQDEINACNGDLIKETDAILQKMKKPLP